MLAFVVLDHSDRALADLWGKWGYALRHALHLTRSGASEKPGAVQSWKDASGLSDEAWQAIKRQRATLTRMATVPRRPLERLCLEDEAPMACEVEMVVEALDRLADLA